MCLDYLRKSEYQPRYGYKVFFVMADKLKSEYFGCGTVRPVDVWLNAKGPKRISLGYEQGTYENGWHCFYTKKDALKWKHRMRMFGRLVVRKVEISKAVAFGLQYVDRSNNLSVFVCKKIRILPKVTNE